MAWENIRIQIFGELFLILTEMIVYTAECLAETRRIYFRRFRLVWMDLQEDPQSHMKWNGTLDKVHSISLYVESFLDVSVV